MWSLRLVSIAISSALPMSAFAEVGTIAALPSTLAQTADRDRAIACLTTAIAYEAAFESHEGQQAVAEVVLNRVRHPAYPKTVCGVVFAGSERRTGCQFSFTCDGSLARRMSPAVMLTARGVAEAALDGRAPNRVAGATHYHADYVSPYWAPSLIRIAKIGAHIFYRGAGSRDQGQMLAALRPTGEPLIASLDAGSLRSAVRTAGNRDGGAPAIAASPPEVFAPWGLTLPRSEGDR